MAHADVGTLLPLLYDVFVKQFLHPSEAALVRARIDEYTCIALSKDSSTILVKEVLVHIVRSQLLPSDLHRHTVPEKGNAVMLAGYFERIVPVLMSVPLGKYSLLEHHC